MKITMFDTKPYDKKYFEEVNPNYGFDIKYLESTLGENSAIMAKGSDAVCPFVNCNVDKKVIDILADEGIRLIAMRSAGFNNVDLKRAAERGLKVVRVPAYSPHAVAEHSFAMLLTLVRKMQHAYVRTREFNFSLSGLEGFDLYGKTIGIIGTGKIGRCAADIAKGFGMHIMAYDPYPQQIEGIEYANLEQLLKKSDIISLYCPLTKDNRHLINAESLKMIKKNAVIINTSRGGLVNSEDLLDALKEKRLAGAALDVYEEEAGIFFTDQSSEGIEDDTLARLISMPNVIVTSHQGYLTEEALRAISETTLKNISEFEQGLPLSNEIK